MGLKTLYLLSQLCACWVGEGGNTGTPRTGKTDTREASTLYQSQVMARSKKLFVNSGASDTPQTKAALEIGSTRLSRQKSGPNKYSSFEFDLRIFRRSN